MFEALILSALLQLSAAPAGCGNEGRYATLAVWVGEWDVTTAKGQPAGTSRVERSPDGCGLVEHWGGRPPGTGLHAYNRTTQQWTHLWVDASGFTATLTGTVENDAVVYRRSSQQGGIERQHRMTLAPALGGIVQTGEHSDDGGKTWQRDFQLTYARRAA